MQIEAESAQIPKKKKKKTLDAALDWAMSDFGAAPSQPRRCFVSGAYGVCLWKFIRSGWLNFSKFIWFDVGDGTRVKFWDDVWCRDRPLKEAFLDLYNISRSRDASVSKVMCCANGRISWDVQFHCLVNDQESHSLDSFLVLIYSTKVRGVGSDKFCWEPASSRGFKVSGY